MGPWQRIPGSLLLPGAALVHSALGLASIALRRSLVMSASDAVQLFLGLLTPPLLVSHVLTMELTGALDPAFHASYGLLLAVFWNFAPL